MTDDLDMDAEGLPDEPGVLDPWAYDSAPAALIGSGIVFGIAAMAAGGWVAWEAWKVRKQ